MTRAASGVRALVTRLAGWCAGHAVTVIVTTLMLAVLAGAFTVDRFRIDSDLDDLIDRDAPFRARQLDLTAAFPDAANQLVLVIRGATLDDRLFAARTLRDTLAEQPGLVAAVWAPAIDPFFARNALLYSDVDEVEATLDRLAEMTPLLSQLAVDANPTTLIDLLANAMAELPPDDPQREAVAAAIDALVPSLEAAAAGAPTTLGWLDLLADDAAVGPVILQVSPVLDRTRIMPSAEALAATRRLAAALEQDVAGLDIALTGSVALRAEELETVKIGASMAGLLSLALVTVILAVGLRSVGTIFAVLATLIVGLVFTAAVALLTVGTFTMISVAFAVLFIGLGVDFAIHVALRVQEASDGTAAGWHAAVAEGTGAAGTALLLCGPTTAAAFFAFAPTAYIGLAQLGLIAGFGMLIALALALTFLPALLTLIGGRRPLPRLTLPVLPRTLRLALTLALVGFATFGFVGIGSVRFDGDPLALRAQAAPSVLAFRELLGDPGASPYIAELLVEDAEAAAVAEARLAAIPEVGSIVDVRSFVPDEMAAKLALIDDASLFVAVPDYQEPTPVDAEALIVALHELEAAAPSVTAAAAAGALAAHLSVQPDSAAAIGEAWFARWAPALQRLAALLQAEPVDSAALPPALVERYVAGDGRYRLQVFPATPLLAQDQREHFVRALLAVEPTAAGDVVQMTGATELVARAMVQATALAFVAVGLIVAIVLRRTADVVAVLGTLAIAAGLTLGAVSLFDLSFNFANVVVLPLLLGFGVDAAVHMVMRWRESGASADFGSTSTGRAVLLSALTTIASFGTLALSPHRGTASMGLLLTIAIVASLAAALIALPFWLERRRR
ncbi:MAG: MMPL family transporter [Pseudomonadota bacterium]